MPANQLHPVYHSYSHQSSSRIEVQHFLPTDLDDADIDELIEKLSEPPKYVERIAPVTTTVGTEIVRGKNWGEMMIHSYRVFLRIFSQVAFYVRQSLGEKFGERGMIAYSSVTIEPDVIHRIIELDYEQGETTYSQLMELFRTNVVSPCATVPFHAILPLLDSDFDRRLCIRVGVDFYWDLVKMYHSTLRASHGEPQFVFTFWFPECGFTKTILQILDEEFQARVKADKIRDAHLTVLMDSVQTHDQDNDVLMKSWNIVTVGKNKITTVFRDRSFSEWVTYSNPSVKKLIDRTIAKVDSELNIRNVDYGWSHCEEIESLTFSPKSAVNFEQKIVKLSQLSYMPVSPDVYSRRKLNRRFGLAEHEPQEVKLRDSTGCSDWHTHISLGRWEGTLDSNAPIKLVDESRPFIRRTRQGKVQEVGPQCWKIAFTKARAACTSHIKGDPDTMKGGFLEILAELSGQKDPAAARKNVLDFLAKYAMIHWREHYLQHNYGEADVFLTELVTQHLTKGSKKRLKDHEIVVAGVAAQGYYFALDSHRSHATYWEMMDQRATYHDVLMLVSAMCRLVYLYHWRDEAHKAKSVIALMQTELFEFDKGYLRYRLADYGVTEQEWWDSIKSMLDETKMNIIERAARRAAARQLRPLGYRKEFGKDDEKITTNVGHIWTAEVENANYKWENKFFCGIREE